MEFLISLLVVAIFGLAIYGLATLIRNRSRRRLLDHITDIEVKIGLLVEQLRTVSSVVERLAAHVLPPEKPPSSYRSVSADQLSWLAMYASARSRWLSKLLKSRSRPSSVLFLV